MCFKGDRTLFDGGVVLPRPRGSRLCFAALSVQPSRAVGGGHSKSRPSSRPVIKFLLPVAPRVAHELAPCALSRKSRPLVAALAVVEACRVPHYQMHKLRAWSGVVTAPCGPVRSGPARTACGCGAVWGGVGSARIGAFRTAPTPPHPQGCHLENAIRIVSLPLYCQPSQSERLGGGTPQRPAGSATAVP